jgi:hypothetical protein
VDTGLQLIRFFNNCFFYTNAELAKVIKGLGEVVTPEDYQNRCDFFHECVQRRRRLMKKWEGTPVSKIFLEESKHATIGARGILAAIKGKVKALLQKYDSLASLVKAHEKTLQIPTKEEQQLMDILSVSHHVAKQTLERTQNNAQLAIDTLLRQGLPQDIEDPRTTAYEVVKADLDHYTQVYFASGEDLFEKIVGTGEDVFHQKTFAALFKMLGISETAPAATKIQIIRMGTAASDSTDYLTKDQFCSLFVPDVALAELPELQPQDWVEVGLRVYLKSPSPYAGHELEDSPATVIAMSGQADAFGYVTKITFQLENMPDVQYTGDRNHCYPVTDEDKARRQAVDTWCSGNNGDFSANVAVCPRNKWKCSRCTFFNHISSVVCEMCCLTR